MINDPKTNPSPHRSQFNILDVENIHLFHYISDPEVKLIKYIIFDFDGVIVDTEPIHLNAFKQIVKEVGIHLEDSEYYSKYLAYDDITFFHKCLTDHGITKTEGEITELVKKKSRLIDELFAQELNLFPGIEEFIKKKSKDYTLAIGSGALRNEIEYILRKFDLITNFSSIVSADEVENCKPDPEVYIKVLESLNLKDPEGRKSGPEECLVIEDSIYGIQAAKSAGMKCLAVTNSYSEEQLKEADIVIETFRDFDCGILQKM